MRVRLRLRWILRLGLVLPSLACGDEPPEPTEAQQLGLGDQCMNHAQCELKGEGVDSEFELACLNGFDNGACGIIRCAQHDECPDGSACIGHHDGFNYCFLLCDSTDDCNTNRADTAAAVCSDSERPIGPDLGAVCVPPD